jgi:hypothetical protein
LKTSDIIDPLFREAVEAIDAGDIKLLGHLLKKNPSLVEVRLPEPAEGYFKQPYLLWFVADNPIRIEKLPFNIVEIAALIIASIEKKSRQTLQQQLDYTLGLAATGRTLKECGVQIELMDLLIGKGASVGSSIGVLAHGNFEAAEFLISKGSPVTLTVAVCMKKNDLIAKLYQQATTSERELALVAASFYGNAEIVDYFIRQGVNVNAWPQRSSGFHSHATALHQAVYAASLECVKMLVKAGADLNATDKIYGGTAQGWSQYAQTGTESNEKLSKYNEIEKFLLAAQKK